MYSKKKNENKIYSITKKNKIASILLLLTIMNIINIEDYDSFKKNSSG